MSTLVLQRIKDASLVLFKLYNFLQVALFCFFTYQIIQSVVLNKGDARKLVNKYCITNKQACVDFASRNVGDFDKTIYMWLDGISYDTAQPIFDVFPVNNTHLYTVAHDALPWSGAVFATYFTGKSQKNMGPVKADNIFNQFFNTDKRILLGLEDSPAYVMYAMKDFLEDNDGKFYENVWNDDGSGAMFDWLFHCGEQTNQEHVIEDCVNKIFDNAKREERSFFLESFFLDHMLHYKVDSRFDPQATKVISEFGSNLKYIKSWIDANPDYLLILMSDHGGHTPGSSLHGDWTDPNNYAFNLYYNPNLKQRSEVSVLKPADVTPTMWQYFAASGVSIPAESNGKIRVASEDPDAILQGLKINAEQLRQYAKHMHIKAGPVPEPTGDFEDSQQQLEEYISTLSVQVQKTNFITNIVLVSILLVIQIFQIVKIQFTSFFNDVKKYGFLYLIGAYVTWILFSRFMVGWNYQGRENFNMYIYLIISLCSVVAVIANRKFSSYTLSSTRSSVAVAEDRSYIQLKLLKESDNEAIANVEEGISNNDTEDGFWDFIRTKRFGKVAQHIGLYLCGLIHIETNNRKTNNAHFAVLFGVIFGITIAILKSLPNQTFLGITDIPFMSDETSIRAGFTYLILCLEVWWQRRLILTHLNEDGLLKMKDSFRNLLRPCFVPMYIKFLVYFIIFALIFRYDISLKQGDELDFIPWMIYCFATVHIVILLFCPSHLQRDLLLPFFALQMITNNHMEQLMMCFYILCMIPLSNILLNNYNVRGSCANHTLSTKLVSYVVFLMFVVTHYFYYAMDSQTYVIDELSVEVRGIRDATLYPVMSVALMLFHKLSTFILLVPFLIRLDSPNLPSIMPFKISPSFSFGYVRMPSGLRGSSEENRCQTCDSDDKISCNRMIVWNVLYFFGMIMILVFLLLATVEVKNENFMWVVSTCLIIGLYGVFMLCSEVSRLCMQLAGKLKLVILR